MSDVGGCYVQELLDLEDSRDYDPSVPNTSKMSPVLGPSAPNSDQQVQDEFYWKRAVPKSYDQLPLQLARIVVRPSHKRNTAGSRALDTSKDKSKFEISTFRRISH